MKKSLIILSLLFCFGCNIQDLDFSDLEGPVLSGKVALPIGNVSYTMRDLMEEVGDSSLQLEEDSTSLIIMTYFDSTDFDNIFDVIQIEDISSEGYIYLPSFPVSSESRPVIFEDTLIFSYPASENEILDSVFYSSGQLNFSIRSEISNNISYEVSIQNTRRISNNNPVNFTGTVSGGGSQNDTRDLTAFKTELTTIGDSNTYSANIRITIDLAAGESVPQDGLLVMNLGYVDQVFSLLYGKFGQDTLTVGDQVLDIKFFDELGESGFRFGSPEITFHFESTFGLPFGVLFNGMYGVNKSDNTSDTLYLTGAATTNPQIVEQSSEPYTGQSSQVVLNKNNSSIQDFLATTPSSIGLSITAIANPLDALQSNFISDSSDLKTAIEISLPLELSLDNLTRDINFDLGSGLNFDEAEELTMRIVSLNGLPFSGRLEIEIKDELDSVIHVVPQVLILQVPILNGNGIVTQSREMISDVYMDVDGVNALRVGKNLTLRMILNTPSESQSRETYVKILADYKIDVQVSVLGKLKAEL